MDMDAKLRTINLLTRYRRIHPMFVAPESEEYFELRFLFFPINREALKALVLDMFPAKVPDEVYNNHTRS